MKTGFWRWPETYLEKSRSWTPFGVRIRNPNQPKNNTKLERFFYIFFTDFGSSEARYSQRGEALACRQQKNVSSWGGAAPPKPSPPSPFAFWFLLRSLYILSGYLLTEPFMQKHYSRDTACRGIKWISFGVCWQSFLGANYNQMTYVA